MELRARRDNTTEISDSKRQRTNSLKKTSCKSNVTRRSVDKKESVPSDTTSAPKTHLVSILLPLNAAERLDQNAVTNEKELFQNKLLYSDSVSAILGDEGESDSEMEIDPCALTSEEINVKQEPVDDTNSNQEWDQIMSLFCTDKNETKTNELEKESEQVNTDDRNIGVEIKKEFEDDCGLDSNTSVFTSEPCSSLFGNDNIGSESEREDACSTVPQQSEHDTCSTGPHNSEPDYMSDESRSICSDVTQKPATIKKKKKRQKRIQEESKPTEEKCVGMSVYEEKQLLSKIQGHEQKFYNNPEAARFRRKLILRDLKRQMGLPLFDLDAIMNKFAGNQHLNQKRERKYSESNAISQLPDSIVKEQPMKKRVNILDRFQTHHAIKPHSAGTKFLNKLVGTEDHQLQCILSPYTSRFLKPFIRRDYETRPAKMKLLMEIQAFPHRNDPTWKIPEPPSIDYCYVRPQHIPSVNALCREFFWPGIDLSECLEYPDFSCVVLYRKFVIGFAFMVPDVDHQEAYISFLFTHPEWRRAGIAKFMIYHLIQTCMGKDITLHVSANNPAMLLYQKFGFKPEEMILDFYEKYFPADSKDSRHAFFLRLRR